MEIVEKSKVGLSPDSHNAWKPAQNAGFHIPPATVAASTIKANAAEPLESRGFTDSRAEPEIKRRRRSPIKPQFLCSLKSAGKGSEIWRIQVKHLVVRFDRIPLRLPRC